MEKVKNLIKNLSIFIFNVAKFYYKRIGCKHEYEYKGTVSVRGESTSYKYIVSSYHYECVKCEKKLSVNMDEQHQIDGCEYISKLWKDSDESYRIN